MAKKFKILVTGANGQLGQCIKQASSSFDHEFFYFSSSELDITDKSSVEPVCKKINPDFIINAAAYTQVDKAEDEEEQAFAVNHIGVRNLTDHCKQSSCGLIHISTDYVFDGEKNSPYLETDEVNPQTVYGRSKLAGEVEIIDAQLEKFAILRTSWLYSSFGHNFPKTMLKLAKDRDSLKVVNDQHGSPTSAHDLAEAILQIIPQLTSENSGLYHFSNSGITTWFGFAKELLKQREIEIELHPVFSDEFPAKAKRPKYSKLENVSVTEVFNLEVKDWKISLDKTVFS